MGWTDGSIQALHVGSKVKKAQRQTKAGLEAILQALEVAVEVPKGSRGKTVFVNEPVLVHVLRELQRTNELLEQLVAQNR